MNDRELTADRELIESLGGPAKVAELLAFDKDRGGIQRVHNWLSRGIPSAIKVKRPDLFLSAVRRARPREQSP